MNPATQCDLMITIAQGIIPSIPNDLQKKLTVQEVFQIAEAAAVASLRWQREQEGQPLTDCDCCSLDVWTPGEPAARNISLKPGGVVFPDTPPVNAEGINLKGEDA